MTPWGFLKAESEKLGWPTHYKSDIYGDRYIISRLTRHVPAEEQKWAWAIGTWGTWFMFPNTEGMVTANYISQNQNLKFYIWDGCLIETTGESAAKFIGANLPIYADNFDDVVWDPKVPY